MNSNQPTGQPHAAAAAAPDAATARMRAAIGQAVAVAPGFLQGKVDAVHMANAMVGAVHGYVERERAAGGNDVPHGAEARALQGVLSELMACGSGYLAGRCDAACVARTMTQMVREFPPN